MNSRDVTNTLRAVVALLAGLTISGSAISAQDVLPIPTNPVALRQLIGEAALVNSRIPDRLRAYRARVETEMSLALLDSGNRERTAQIEQIESDVRYRNPDRYDQRVVGYRSQAVGPMFSLMSIFGGWTTPTLYGNHLQLGVTSVNASNRTINPRGSTLAIHPLGA
ncbi:MAG: hypothetical protein ABIS03_11235, partial [Gemmatimonadaceae bacterium]